MRVEHILETALYCQNLDAMEKFYTQVLGLKVYSKVPDRHVFFKLKNGMLLIFNPVETKKVGQKVPQHGVEGQGHIAFAVPPEAIPIWQERLKSKNIPIETVINWNGGGTSIYFRDPAGNSVEIATPDLWGYNPEEFGK